MNDRWLPWLGAACCLVALVWLAHRALWAAHAERADGTVERVYSTYGYRGRSHTYAVVKYTPDEGPPRTVRADTAWGVGLKQGDAVPVDYDPLDPADAEVRTFRNYWFWPVATLCFGLFLIGGGWFRRQGGRSFEL